MKVDDDNDNETFQFHCQCRIWWSSRLVSTLWFSSQAKLHSPVMMITMTMKMPMMKMPIMMITTEMMMDCYLTKTRLAKYIAEKDEIRKQKQEMKSLKKDVGVCNVQS